MTIEGGCRCGAVRYALSVDRMPPVYCCHCRDCQSWSGSAFSEQAVVRPDALSVTGPIAQYSMQSHSGSTSHQFVCGTCHTRIHNTNTARSGIALIRAGTLDTSDTLEPAAHIWTKRKQPWITIPDGIPVFEENAPVADFVAILTGTAG